MVRKPDDAIAHIAQMSENAKPFDVGMCKQQARLAYGVSPSRSGDATEAFHETKHRIDVTPGKAPRGALAWWTGGSKGHGHVAIMDGKGGAWSTDIKRDGHWDHVPFAKIGQKFTKCKFAGFSLDIDGVQVVPSKTAAARTAPKPDEPVEVTRVRNAIKNRQEVPLNDLERLIKRGEKPYAAAAKQLRDAIRPAAQRWRTKVAPKTAPK